MLERTKSKEIEKQIERLRLVYYQDFRSLKDALYKAEREIDQLSTKAFRLAVNLGLVWDEDTRRWEWNDDKQMQELKQRGEK